jgi:hypothetical protein
MAGLDPATQSKMPKALVETPGPFGFRTAPLMPFGNAVIAFDGQALI